MEEYINRGTAIAKLTALEETEPNATMADAKRVLADMQTADAVPVVRCKDCKYYKISELHPPFKFCFRLRHPTENRSVGYHFADDDFCSHGECREGKDG